jgi:MFS family permease
MPSVSSDALSSRMTSGEIRASASLASIFALRMLGMFLILPVFSVHAQSLPGGESATLVGLAMGIYGLTQSFGQIPFGAASDKYGRKRVIVIGLILFALGSFVAAAANDLLWVTIGRALQGAGAISAAVTAFIADSTRDEHRTKAMAMVGGSIGLTFALSLVAAPVMYRLIGMNGIFALTGILSLIAILVVVYVVPPAPQAAPVQQVPFSAILANRELMRLNYGVFALHATQMAMFVVMPSALVQYLDLPLSAHWKVYLPVVFASFALMLPPVFVGEKRGRTKQVFLAAIALMLLVQAGLWLFMSQPMHWSILVLLLLAFFVSFNILEASQPSLVSRIAPPASKGAALGVYNTLQALGLFCGGVLGGSLQEYMGPSAVFALGAALSVGWLIIAASMKNLPRRGVIPAVA